MSCGKGISGDKNLENIILLNDEMIISTIWLEPMWTGVHRRFFYQMQRFPWYEVDKEVELIPDEARDIEIIFRNIMTKEIIRENTFK